MASAPLGATARHLSRLFGAGTVAGMSEGQLLERFASSRDPAAFEALVEQHGPMVLGICRRTLADPHDADDAFQATFLVLVRRARSLRDRERLGGWLHGVARKVAVRARADSHRRRDRERALGHEPFAGPTAGDDPARRDLAAAIHEEVARLPEKYREPIRLCDLGGLTHEEAARRLGCPVGTVKGRQSRARALLKRRLDRRGLAPTAGLLAATLAREASAAVAVVVPAALRIRTIEAAALFASGRAAEVGLGLVSAQAIALTQGVLSTMMLAPWKIAGTALLATGFVVGGAGAWSYQLSQADGAPALFRAAPDDAPAQDAPPAASRRAESPAQPAPPAGSAVPARVFYQAEPARPAPARRPSPEPTPSPGPRPSPAPASQIPIDQLIEDARNELGKLENSVPSSPVNDHNRLLELAKLRLQAFETLRDLQRQTPARTAPPAHDLLDPFAAVPAQPGVAATSTALPSSALAPLPATPAGEPLPPPAANQSPFELDAPAVAATSLQPARQPVLASPSSPPIAPTPLAETTPLVASPSSPPIAPHALADPTPLLASPSSPPIAPTPLADPTPLPAIATAPPDPPLAAPPTTPQLEPLDPAQAIKFFVLQGQSNPVGPGGVLIIGRDPRSMEVGRRLGQPITMQFPNETPLEDVLKYLKQATAEKNYPGISYYVDPLALQKVERTLTSPVSIDVDGVSARTALRLLLHQIDLTYIVRDGLLIITDAEPENLRKLDELLGAEAVADPMSSTST